MTVACCTLRRMLLCAGFTLRRVELVGRNKERVFTHFEAYEGDCMRVAHFE
jgi:hypothetical protein